MLGLTIDGEGVDVEDYCVRLTSLPSTHAVLLQDMSVESTLKSEHIASNHATNELNLTDFDGLNRLCSFHATPLAI